MQQSCRRRRRHACSAAAAARPCLRELFCPCCAACRDYLTGFHKRKVARRKEALKKLEKRQREQRLEERAEVGQGRGGKRKKARLPCRHVAVSMAHAGPGRRPLRPYALRMLPQLALVACDTATDPTSPPPPPTPPHPSFPAAPASNEGGDEAAGGQPQRL